MKNRLFPMDAVAGVLIAVPLWIWLTNRTYRDSLPERLIHWLARR